MPRNVPLSGSTFGRPIVVGTSLVLIHEVPLGKNDEVALTIENDNSGSGDDITVTWTDRDTGTTTETFTIPSRSSASFVHTLAGGVKIEAQAATIADFRLTGSVRRS